MRYIPLTLFTVSQLVSPRARAAVPIEILVACGIVLTRIGRTIIDH